MKKGIIGAGNWIIDKVKTIDRWPNEGELCNILSQQKAGGGGPCNVLFDLAALKSGIPLYAAGMVGSDDDGAWLRGEIETRGIDSRYMKTAGEGIPTAFTDVMSGNGRRTFFYCGLANNSLGVEDMADIDVPAKIFYLGYLLLLDKLDAADPEYGTVAARLLALMQKKGYRTAVDMVSEAGEKFNRIVPPAMKYTDILVINEIEAGNTLGEAIRQPDNSLRCELFSKAADRFFELGVKEMVVIHFPEGAYAAVKDGIRCYQPSCFVKKSEIVGTNGAGDAFFAGLLYAIHEDMPMEEALKVASASARFNLKAATASGGAPELGELLDYVKTCGFEEIPEYFR